MFLHLGNNYMVRKDQVVAILDLESTGSSQSSRNLLNNIIQKNKVLNVAENGKEKSFIITDKQNYFSPISSSTLLKRSMYNNNFDTL